MTNLSAYHPKVLIMKKNTLTTTSLILLSLTGAHAQIVTSSSAGFGTVIDSFEADSTGIITTGYMTAAGGTIDFATNSSLGQRIEAADSAGTLYGNPVTQGTQVWSFRAGGPPFFHKAEYTFASTQSDFGIHFGDFGDGTSPSALKITASDGTVLYAYDEAVDGLIAPAIDFFTGVTGGSFTGFTVEMNSNGSDNTFINAIVTTPVPEPSSALLLGLSGMALIGRRKRA